MHLKGDTGIPPDARNVDEEEMSALITNNMKNSQ